MPETIQKVADDIAKQSGGKFTFEMVDPDCAGAKLDRAQALLDTFKLQPIPVSLFSDQTVLPGHGVDRSATRRRSFTRRRISAKPSVRTAIESALKRSSSGFLKVVGLWTPPAQPQPDQFGQQQRRWRRGRSLQQQLGQDYTVRSIDLTGGQVPPDVDVLVVDRAAEHDRQGTLRDRSVPDARRLGDRGGGQLRHRAIAHGRPGPGSRSRTACNEMLDAYGISVGQTLVMDPQNEPFPVQVERNVGGMPGAGDPGGQLPVLRRCAARMRMDRSQPDRVRSCPP